ncbi:MAG TPA: type I-C CRISPR-associated protein Cas8c/Csd1 [Caldithrix abyssi]|uniref:Type I-C CRISPR-associated protein Cas8c/Csd1 n=1 Tax=Caldithrix abyssi TaxID=187145 RepID=A0A7V4TZP9_CALAY|nr:type I-C CRISPR-associated protein Cas8c/Csd1 [Caldithrix abyssi]
MILQELTRFYNRLLDNPQVDICEPGFSKENISFKIVLTENGELFDKDRPIQDLRVTDGRNVRPVKITVPKFDGKRANGIKPYFLWDKTDYIIGMRKNTNTGQEERMPKHNKAFIELIDTITSTTQKNHSAIQAVKTFCLKSSNIDLLKNSEYWDDFLNSFVVFSIYESEEDTVFGIKEVKNIWKEYYPLAPTGQKVKKGICLVSGEITGIAQLHPTIKKGVGGKNDIPLISCNFNAGESFNFEKNENAPISASAASAIAGALNYLLDNRSYNLTIADTRTLYWAETNDRFAEYFGQIMDPRKDEGRSADLEAFLHSVRRGKLPPELENSGRFFVLGLAPNAARISVRFWYVDDVEQIALHIGRHFADLQIVRQNEKRETAYPSAWQLLIETAVQHKSDNIAPNLAGPFLHSILSGGPYPSNLLALLISRLRAEQDTEKTRKLNYYRAAFIKAILNRNYKKELAMSLDKNRNALPYLLGRLFALLEKIQEDSAGGNLNATVKDRYFSSASTTPRTAFPVLLRLTQNHLKKLKSENPGLAVVREKELGEVMEKLEAFPATLKLEDQGEFAIGYYHQRQDFFKKKEQPEALADEAEV